MPNTALYLVKDAVQALLDNSREMTGFDFFVVDGDMIRIAGTGKYKTDIGLRLPIKCGSAYVVENSTPVTIYNPKLHEVCEDCSLRDDCYGETMFIYPIMDGDRSIGASALSAFSEDMTVRQRKDEKILKEFLVHLNQHIALLEKEKSGMPALIVNSLDEMIVVTDRAGKVLYVNNKASDSLQAGDQLDFFYPAGDCRRVIRDNKGFRDVEGIIKRGGREERVFVSASIFNMRGEQEILFLFKSYKSMEKLIYACAADYSEAYAEMRNIIGNSPLLKQVKEIAVKASQTDSNVMIQGESGTGKELFAKAIHSMSKNSKGSFIAVNCAAIPENLLESELFGYEEGAFTGAKKGGKPGLLELANDGTIFLDELGDLSPYLQPKLLRAIESREVTRVGGTKVIAINARIITATNRDLEQDIEDGRFRKDLYYRLNVIPLVIPSLRKRPEDIVLLARLFLSRYAGKFNKDITDFTLEAEKAFLLYEWPGNVRELENVVEYLANVETENSVQFSTLPARLKGAAMSSLQGLPDHNIRNIEGQFIRDLLDKYGSSVKGKEEIAKELGMSMATLYRKMKSYGI